MDFFNKCLGVGSQSLQVKVSRGQNDFTMMASLSPVAAVGADPKKSSTYIYFLKSFTVSFVAVASVTALRVV
jgi:hypothetical protein